PVDPRELNSAIPDALAAVLARMMAKSPGQRYQSAEDLIGDLENLIAHWQPGSDPTQLAKKIISAWPAPQRLQPAIALSLCAAFLAIVVTLHNILTTVPPSDNRAIAEVSTAKDTESERTVGSSVQTPSARQDSPDSIRPAAVTRNATLEAKNAQ